VSCLNATAIIVKIKKINAKKNENWPGRKKNILIINMVTKIFIMVAQGENRENKEIKTRDKEKILICLAIELAR
jgi:hypothetical protein